MTTISPELILGVNYWAVLVAGLVTFFLGGLWYSPMLFENAWMSANGLNSEQVAALQESLGVAGFSGTFLAYLVMSMVLATLIAMLGIQSIAGTMTLAAILWLGFVATTGLTVNLFSVRSLTAWIIDAGFQFVGLVIAGAVLGAWR